MRQATAATGLSLRAFTRAEVLLLEGSERWRDLADVLHITHLVRVHVLQVYTLIIYAWLLVVSYHIVRHYGTVSLTRRRLHRLEYARSLHRVLLQAGVHRWKTGSWTHALLVDNGRKLVGCALCRSHGAGSACELARLYALVLLALVQLLLMSTH